MCEFKFTFEDNLVEYASLAVDSLYLFTKSDRVVDLKVACLLMGAAIEQSIFIVSKNNGINIYKKKRGEKETQGFYTLFNFIRDKVIASEIELGTVGKHLEIENILSCLNELKKSRNELSHSEGMINLDTVEHGFVSAIIWMKLVCTSSMTEHLSKTFQHSYLIELLNEHKDEFFKLFFFSKESGVDCPSGFNPDCDICAEEMALSNDAQCYICPLCLEYKNVQYCERCGLRYSTDELEAIIEYGDYLCEHCLEKLNCS